MQEVELHTSWLNECAGVARLSMQLNYMMSFFSLAIVKLSILSAKYF